MPSSEDNRNVRGGRRGASVVSGRGRKDSSRGRHRYGNEHFSAGGCKSDPLNIRNVGSGDEIMPDDEIVREESEKPIEVFIPKNTRDPLNLNRLEKSRKKRKAQEERDGTMSPNPKKQSRTGSPRTSSPKPDSESVGAASEVATTLAEKKKNKKEYFNNRYCYGNFDRYYGTRLGPGQKDSRLNMLKKEWFERRSVLDIGCNVGFLTLSLAKDFSPRRILGIDIDEHLIGVARKNIRHYCDKDIEFNGKFPASFSNQFGPIANQPLSFSTKFPDNIWFRKENYVLENDELLETIEEEFDVILALSITKWIHLNFGDDGLRRFFRRAFRQLLPGGRFIIEPQPFESYRKRAKMTETLKANYEKIEFKPSEFEMFLLDQVGFERVEQLGTVSAKSKGFERPVDVYVKKAPKFMTRGGKVADKDTSKSSSDGAATS